MGGGDKGLVALCGKPLVEHALAALSPQVNTVIINANRNRERYAAYGHPVIADSRQGFQGPLAGMLSCIEAAGDRIHRLGPLRFAVAAGRPGGAPVQATE